MAKTKKLSAPQVKFLLACSKAPSETPFVGGRNAGRVANAWYRTAASLRDQGLVHVSPIGDHEVAVLTDAGRAVLAKLEG